MKSIYSVDKPIRYKNGMRPVHPGEVLQEDYLKPLNMSVSAAAEALQIDPTQLNKIVMRRRGVTVAIAIRVTRFFVGDVRSWLNLQLACNSRLAEMQ